MSSSPQSPCSYQSSPSNSAGCCVRPDPFPHRKSSTEQYLSQPQQIRSGCFGCSGNFLTIGFYDFMASTFMKYPLGSKHCLSPPERLIPGIVGWASGYALRAICSYIIRCRQQAAGYRQKSQNRFHHNAPHEPIVRCHKIKTASARRPLNAGGDGQNRTADLWVMNPSL